MEDELLESIHLYAHQHWWFRGRQKIVLSLLDRYFGRSDGEVLDLGCGPGNNLKALSKYGTLTGADASTAALKLARQDFDGPLDEIWLPDKLPYADKQFDLIVMLDVLEHVEDHIGAMHRILRILKPGGVLAMTVPALRWLWSSHDVTHQHFRRYHRGELRRIFERLGFELPHISYINFFLLPIMGAARMVWKPKTWSANHLEAGTRPWSKVLEAIFSFERRCLWVGTLPIGGSLVAIARRPENLELEPWVKGMGLPKKNEAVGVGASAGKG